MIAADTESLLIQPGIPAPELVCLTFADSSGAGILHHTEARPKVTEILQQHSTYANAVFDLGVFGNVFPDLIPDLFQALDEDRIHDVQAREKIIDISLGSFRFSEDPVTGEHKAKGYSLANLVFRHFGRHMEKDLWRLRYHDLYHVPLDQWPQGAITYATTDAIDTLAVHLVQEKYKERAVNATAQVRAHWALHLISAWGFATDSAAVDRLERRVRDELAEVTEYLQREKLIRPNGSRDTKAAKQRMWDLGGRTLTAKGDELRIAGETFDNLKYLALNIEACEEVEDKPAIKVASKPEPISVMAAYALYSRLQNLLTGSVKHFRAPVVHCRFDPIKKTGRTGSSGPNLQNVRSYPGVRQCLRARDGCVLIACDYGMCELRTHAQFCFDNFGYSDLGTALNEGIDVHSKIAAAILGMPYEEYCKRILTDKALKKFRTLGKAVNFGLPGGCGALRFVGLAKGYGQIITLQEAAKHKAMWKHTWSEMGPFFNLIASQGTGNGLYYVYNERMDRLHYGCSYTAACNLTFQGPAADGAKMAMYRATREQFCDKSSPLYGTRFVNFVHDELILEAPKERAHECAIRLQQIMEEEMLKITPDFPVPAEPAMMTHWDKDAEPVWKDGRLQVWEAA